MVFLCPENDRDLAAGISLNDRTPVGNTSVIDPAALPFDQAIVFLDVPKTEPFFACESTHTQPTLCLSPCWLQHRYGAKRGGGGAHSVLLSTDREGGALLL